MEERKGEEKEFSIFNETNVKDLEKINQEMTEFDLKREEVIKQSRDILKNSKKAIFASHRKDYQGAQKLLEEAEKKAKHLLETIIQGDSQLRGGSFSGALEEFAEAKIFLHYLQSSSLLPSSSFHFLESTEYLGGVIDFTGEVTRTCVAEATNRNIFKVKEIKQLLEDILLSLTNFDFRNGPLRKKFDSVKWNLNKVEGMLYDLSLSSNFTPNKHFNTKSGLYEQQNKQNPEEEHLQTN